MNLQENIQRIKEMMGVITESNSRKNWLLRRLETPDVKGYIEDNISYLTIRSGCEYKKLNDPHWAIMEDLVNNVINFFSEELYDEDDQLEMDMFVWKVLEEMYGDLIREQLGSTDCSNM